jgi:RNA polymerase sigma factor (sigma-70 family)
MCLETLSKNHDKYIGMAFNICRNEEHSRDVVQDAYLKIYDIKQKEPETDVTDLYVWMVIFNIIKDHYRRSKRIKEVSIENALHIAVKDNIVEFSDIEQMYLNRANEFRYLDRGLLVESYDKSLREIETEYKINYGYVYRTLDKTRKLILRDKHNELYKNKRLKHQK